MRTISEINEKIKEKKAVVLRADEFKDLCESESVESAYEKVDVVTCGTFSPTCGVGVMMNMGHTNPPIKFKEAFFNNVRAYTGFTSVDCYIGSDQPNEDSNIDIEYSGGHVIQDLIKGKSVNFVANGFGEKCHSYPANTVKTSIDLSDINAAIFLAHRFCVQKGSGYVNSSNKALGTYKGISLPNFGNCVYTGTGELNPLANDPNREIIGIGTRVLISGAVGYVIGEGTQHNPQNGNNTTSLRCELRDMLPEFLFPVVLKNYATSMYVGLAVPIPILDLNIANNCGIRDKDITTVVKDSSEQHTMDSQKTTLFQTNYAELKNGYVNYLNRRIPTSTLSNIKKTIQIIEMLKKMILNGEFFLTENVCSLPGVSPNTPLPIK